MLVRAKSSKTPITLWALLVWAYKRQMVQYERDRAFELRSAASSRNPDFLGRSRGYAGGFLGAICEDEERGCINGAGTIAHVDAHILHRHVESLKRTERKLVIDHAEKGSVPVWRPEVKPLRIVPMWKGPEGRIERVNGAVTVFGKLLRMYPGQAYPGDPNRDRHDIVIGTWVARDGHTDAEAAALRADARKLYARWWSALFEVYRLAYAEQGFERWKISAIGAPREPWNMGD